MGQLGVLLGPNEHARFAIFQDPRHLGLTQAPVQRLRNQPTTGAGVEHLHILNAVLRENGDPITLAEVQLIAEAVRQPFDPLIEGAEGHPPVVGDVNQRLALGVE